MSELRFQRLFSQQRPLPRALFLFEKTMKIWLFSAFLYNCIHKNILVTLKSMKKVITGAKPT
jgi:hypothetical protein